MPGSLPNFEPAPAALPGEVEANVRAARNALRNGLYPRKCTIRGLLCALSDIQAQLVDEHKAVLMIDQELGEAKEKLAAKEAECEALRESHRVINESNKASICLFLSAEAERKQAFEDAGCAWAELEKERQRHAKEMADIQASRDGYKARCKALRNTLVLLKRRGGLGSEVDCAISDALAATEASA